MRTFSTLQEAAVPYIATGLPRLTAILAQVSKVDAAIEYFL